MPGTPNSPISDHPRASDLLCLSLSLSLPLSQKRGTLRNLILDPLVDSHITAIDGLAPEATREFVQTRGCNGWTREADREKRRRRRRQRQRHHEGGGRMEASLGSGGVRQGFGAEQSSAPSSSRTVMLVKKKRTKQNTKEGRWREKSYFIFRQWVAWRVGWSVVALPIDRPGAELPAGRFTDWSGNADVASPQYLCSLVLCVRCRAVRCRRDCVIRLKPGLAFCLSLFATSNELYFPIAKCWLL